MKICETFLSLQGEGLTMGVPTFFIRTVGCNLNCSWCDTKYAFDGGKEIGIDELIDSVPWAPCVCVTGGEPMLQPDIYELLGLLISMGKTTVLETNGSVDLSELPDSPNLMISMDIKCPSSGMEDRMMFSNISLLGKKDQLKFVVGDIGDVDYAEKIIEKYGADTNIIFSPVGGMDLEPLAEEVLKRKLNVRVLPQLHKIIWGDRRSV
ncbi:MAG: 7-carboxy-7-deazaguanine synthase QueE [Candidatus Methanomethylophilaceae archaeon]|jgi:7-carboxy-7-deazaguanine synthase